MAVMKRGHIRRRWKQKTCNSSVRACGICSHLAVVAEHVGEARHCLEGVDIAAHFSVANVPPATTIQKRQMSYTEQS